MRAIVWLHAILGPCYLSHSAGWARNAALLTLPSMKLSHLALFSPDFFQEGSILYLWSPSPFSTSPPLWQGWLKGCKAYGAALVKLSLCFGLLVGIHILICLLPAARKMAVLPGCDVCNYRGKNDLWGLLNTWEDNIWVSFQLNALEDTIWVGCLGITKWEEGIDCGWWSFHPRARSLA